MDAVSVGVANGAATVNDVVVEDVAVLVADVEFVDFAGTDVAGLAAEVVVAFGAGETVVDATAFVLVAVVAKN